MQHSMGSPRNQLRFTSLEDSISQDNSVRFIEAFVEHVLLYLVGFKVQTIENEENIMGKLRDIDGGYAIDYVTAFGTIGRIVAKRKSRIQKKQ
jgi:hypothetical protein